MTGAGIFLALIVVGGVVYSMKKSNTNPPDGQGMPGALEPVVWGERRASNV